MAVTQISRIQHRRGLQQDIPQLASAELGWSVDQRRLFIGNGTLEEGAPSTGITEILTQYSDVTKILGTYTFTGADAGYNAQTGSSLLNPIKRSLQQKFDDFVNIKDFGALGDGTTDDTAAINRALQQIYKVGTVESELRARRTIYFPGGTYITSSEIKVPPHARLIGDGIGSSVIKQTKGNFSVVELADSQFLTGASISSGGGQEPTKIEISNMRFWNSNATVTKPIVNIDSASNVRFVSTQFQSNQQIGYYSNLVNIVSTVKQSREITFDKSIFVNAGNGIGIISDGIQSVHVLNSVFENLSNAAVDMGTSIGFSSINNYYGNVVATVTGPGRGNYSFGDKVYNDADQIGTGIYLGVYTIGTSKTFSVTPSSPAVFPLLANTSAVVDYEVSNSSARRFGTFRYHANTVATLFDDDYLETTTSVQSNVFANVDSLICSTTGGTMNFKFVIKKFL